MAAEPLGSHGSLWIWDLDRPPPNVQWNVQDSGWARRIKSLGERDTSDWVVHPLLTSGDPHALDRTA